MLCSLKIKKEIPELKLLWLLSVSMESSIVVTEGEVEPK